EVRLLGDDSTELLPRPMMVATRDVIRPIEDDELGGLERGEVDLRCRVAAKERDVRSAHRVLGKKDADVLLARARRVPGLEQAAHDEAHRLGIAPELHEML